MQFFLVEPEVAGGLGEHTVMDVTTHPPKIHKLNYEFDGWSGDVLLTSFPCYIVTDDARIALEKLRATGISFSEVEVSLSTTFKEIFENKDMPKFHWLKINGVAEKDDFGVASNLRLVISDRALNALSSLGLNEAVVSSYAA
jgi:hypothetical protein